MDEMKINTKFMKRLISAWLSKTIKKKLGYEINLDLNDLKITFDGDVAKVHFDADAEIDKGQLLKINQLL